MESDKFSRAAKDVYKQALQYVNWKEREARETSKITIAQLFELSNRIVKITAESEQLNSFAIYYYDIADITRSHVINTAVFSTVLARGIGYSDDDLVKVCAAALLHDIGIVRLDDAIFKKRISQLKPHEKFAMQNHCGYGYEIVIQSDSNLEELAQSVYQHHEKGDGSGYPKHLVENEMLATAKILSLIDTYETLIHPRDHRDALIPPVGIQELVKEEGNCFSKPLIKALIETISLYPVGCYGRLNSGEIARVIKTNKKYPVRPTIKILYDAKGQRTQHQIIDLSQNNLIFIQTYVPPPGMRKTG